MRTLAENYKAVTLISPRVLAVDSNSGNVSVAAYGDDAAVILQVGDCSTCVHASCILTIATSKNGGSTYTTVATFATLNEASGGIALAKVNLSNVTHIKATLDVTVGVEEGDLAAFPLSVSLLAEPAFGGPSVNSTTPA